MSDRLGNVFRWWLKKIEEQIDLEDKEEQIENAIKDIRRIAVDDHVNKLSREKQEQIPRVSPVLPTIDRSEAPSVRDYPDKIMIGHKDFPETGYDVLRILNELGIKANSLSKNQVNLLRSPVATVNRFAPSPETEAGSQKEKWASYVNDVKHMPSYKHWFGDGKTKGSKKPTAGNVIALLRGYEFKGGWLSRANQRIADEVFDDERDMN